MIRMAFATPLPALVVALASCGGPSATIPEETPRPAPAGSNLFTEAPHDPAACGTVRVFRCRTVRVNLELLSRATTSGTSVKINPFDDVVLDAVLDYTEASDLGSDYRNWRGHIAGSEYSTVGFLFSVSRSRLTGSIALPATYPRNNFSIQPLVGGLHKIEEMDPRGSPPAL